MLLGAATDTKVSRYENFARMPVALTVFALEIVFNQPASELFAGKYQTVRFAVQERAERLAEELNTRPGPHDKKTLRKLALLRAIVEPKPITARRS